MKETDAKTSSSTAKEETSSDIIIIEEGDRDIINGGGVINGEGGDIIIEEGDGDIKEGHTTKRDCRRSQTDSDLKLVEHAFYYITDPPECTKNDNRSIQRKAEKLNVMNGNEVIVVNKTFIFVYTRLFCELL